MQGIFSIYQSGGGGASALTQPAGGKAQLGDLGFIIEASLFENPQDLRLRFTGLLTGTTGSCRFHLIKGGSFSGNGTIVDGTVVSTSPVFGPSSTAPDINADPDNPVVWDMDPVDIGTGLFRLRIGYENMGAANLSISFYHVSFFFIPPVITDVVRMDSVELLAHDTLLLNFSADMVNDDALRDPVSYTLVPFAAGIPTRIKEVQTGHELTTRQVILLFTPPTIGEVYEVTAGSTIKDLDGNTMDPAFKTRKFVDRYTKMDHVRKNMPPHFAMDTKAQLRWVFQAMTRSDERIGGNRNDTFE
jgi:hypothetical protein